MNRSAGSKRHQLGEPKKIKPQDCDDDMVVKEDDARDEEGEAILDLRFGLGLGREYQDRETTVRYPTTGRFNNYKASKSIDVSELHNTRQSTDFEALETVKCSVMK